MKVQHIAIPLDELELFKEDEQYQHFLVETLIYSTRATLHHNHQATSCTLVLTKYHLWMEEEGTHRKKRQLPLSCIREVIKAEEQPEMVLLTEEAEDNLRVSTASEQRMGSIISALSFYFTYLAPEKRSLRLFTIRQNSLLYFERTVKEKKNGPRLNLSRYKSSLIDYVEPNESPDIFGKLVVHRMILVRQLYVEGQYLMHLAQINDKEFYHCHTLSRTEERVAALAKHKNMESVQKLSYAKQLQYKVQVFFEYLPSLKPRTIKLTDLFEQLYRLYDLVRQHTTRGFITPQMLLRSGQDSKRLILREFRYPFLIFDYDYNRFLYQKLYREQSQQDYTINKMFNIGLVMYYYLFGRNPLEHQSLEFTAYLKESMGEVVFPQSMHVCFSKKVQNFIGSCILGQFSSDEQVRGDPWVEVNKLRL